MSFVSTEFIIFALLVIPIFFMLGQRRRWLLLLVASYCFYAYWMPSYLILILFSTLVDYLAALALHSTAAERTTRRRALLTCSILANVGVLFIFKYANLFGQTAEQMAQALGVPLQVGALNVLLPVGISFYTFQSMAYTFDVYRGRLPAERHFGIFATYVAYFPQLVAGPIERATNMLPQFRTKFSFDYDRVVSGLRLAAWGAFKKVVIADRLALYVNEVFDNLESYSGLSLIIAVLFFAFQIYCDFSGYSDIAIGVARVMSFRLMKNFRRPYLATSLRDFWRRWHISLSTWFRDYVYISLGGNRLGFPRQLFNLLLVFVLSGLWHGANWTFMLWGLFHGAVIIAETLFKALFPNAALRNGPGRAFSLVYTFTLVYIGWILFRANDIGEISYILRHLLDFAQGVAELTRPFAAGLLPQRAEFLLSFCLIALVLVVDVIDERQGILAVFRRLSTPWRWAVYYFLAVTIYVSLFYGTTVQEFYYFQF